MANILNNCVEHISMNEFYIIDDIQTNSTKIINENGQFKIINNTNKNLSFLKIDNCVGFDEDTQKCDCAIFNDDVFCFIELKTMTSDKQNLKTKRRKKAEEQLKYTIISFKDEELIQNKTLEAYVSITCFKNENLIPVPLTPNQDKILEFKEDFNVKLQYSCKKEFKQMKKVKCGIPNIFTK